MKKIYLSVLILVFGFIGINNLQSYPYGAPAGYAGGPAESGTTCANPACHGGTATVATNSIISTDVPTEGYTGGNSYTITVTVNNGGRKGFEVSPQLADGTLAGTLTAGTDNTVVNGKYVTHTAAKISSPAVWTFTWKAPVSGTGPVDFYGAFANTKSTTRTQKLTVIEKSATGINENDYLSQLSLYPNPIIGKTLNLAFELKKNANVAIALVDLTGREVLNLENSYESMGSKNYNFNLPEVNNGIYFVQVRMNDSRISKKIWVNR
jgi:hypothetical protein